MNSTRITTPPAIAMKGDEKEPTNVTPTDKGVNVSNSEEPAAKQPWEDLGFKSAEDMAASYKELRTKMSKEGAPAKDEPAKDEPAKDEPAKDEPAKDEDAKAQYEAGINDTFEKTFGKGNAAKVLEWAGEALTEEEAAAFNGALDSGNPAIASYAITVLHQRFKAAEPKQTKEPQLVRATVKVGSPSGVKPFADRSEMLTAFADPKYATSEHYRKQVASRLEVSQF